MEESKDPGTMNKYIFPHNEPIYWSKLYPLLHSIAEEHTLVSLESIPEAMLEIIHLKPGNENYDSLPGISKFLDKSEEFGVASTYEELLPFIASLALEITELFQSEYPFLHFNTPHKLTFTRKQAACLLSHAFFCTLLEPKFEVEKGPDTMICFHSSSNSMALLKLQFYFTYFQSLREHREDTYTGNITLERICNHTMNDIEVEDIWRENSLILRPTTIHKEGSIMEAEDCLQVDFANEYIGGGSLYYGRVQEEIYYLVMPEFILGSIFCSRMLPHEAIRLVGLKYYSKHTGYGNTLGFHEGFIDLCQLDACNRIDRQIVAIDAIMYGYGGDDLHLQFSKSDIDREIIKAYIGFGVEKGNEKDLRNVATGKWGCGAFNGNPQLKFVIQWIAASANSRQMIFYAFGDTDLALQKAPLIIQLFAGTHIQDIYLKTIQFGVKLKKEEVNVNLFDYLLLDNKEKE